ncbi:phage tail protein, partial [Enterobacterales bacterium CwR94]
EESEGATVIREGVGVYRIKNVFGLNSDAAWGGIDGGFDIPQDRNKQPLIWLDYSVDADGSVIVETFHRTHPNAPAFARNIIDGIDEGKPIDIPADQFVSVRVQMPEDSIWNIKQREILEELEQ